MVRRRLRPRLARLRGMSREWLRAEEIQGRVSEHIFACNSSRLERARRGIILYREDEIPCTYFASKHSCLRASNVNAREFAVNSRRSGKCQKSASIDRSGDRGAGWTGVSQRPGYLAGRTNLFAA